MMDLRGEQLSALRQEGRGQDVEGHPDPIAFKSNAISRFLDPEEQAEVEEGRHAGAGGGQAVRSGLSFLEGHMTPIFFGSALRHFGVDQLLDGIGAYAPPPKAVKATRGGDETHVVPGDSEVSGFVFKVQANMDPNHRDSGWPSCGCVRASSSAA